jgi:hypothetical protein
MSTDVLTINGSAITLANFNAQVDRCVPIVKGGIPELHFSRLLGTLKPASLPAIPDVWDNQPVTRTINSVLIFAGTVVGHVDRFKGGAGWVREYRALGLRNSADYVPNTDAISLTDTSIFNLPSDDPNFVAGRAGQTVGQIVSQILTMSTNATALAALGVGAYTSTFPTPTLPALTVSDLAALTVIPPWRVSISGERILQSLESFVQTCHPNHWLHVQPDGTIRFLDMRLCTNNTLTLGSDARLGMPSLTRDYSDCYPQLTVRGNTLAVPVVLQTLPWPGSSRADGGLAEAFEWGTFVTNAAAIANWVPIDYQQPGSFASADDTGTLTCTDATHVTVTSSNASEIWAANYWAGAQGTIYLYGDSVPGIGQWTATKIVANTALTAGGTSVLTLGTALTSLVYGSYKIWGLDAGPSVVWRKYKITSSTIASALLNYFPYPVAVTIAPVNNAAWVTSSIQGYVQQSYTSGGGPPYTTGAANITVDPVGGYVYFNQPTAFIINAATGQYTPPYNVLALLAVANGSLNVTVPQVGGIPGYAGTCYTVEGVRRTKTITCRDWIDQSNTANMTTFATESLGSMQNTVVEGTVPYYGLLSQFLTVGSSGQGVSVTGSTYTTGWESLNLPVVSVELVNNNGPDGTNYTTNLQLSNRRGRYTADQFLRPSVLGSQLGLGSGDSFHGASITPNGPAAMQAPSPGGFSPLEAGGFNALDSGGFAPGGNNGGFSPLADGSA